MRDVSQHERRTAAFARILERQAPPAGDAEPCPYLLGRSARLVTILPEPMAAGDYHSLMDLNFRRVGQVFYRPSCAACAECRMIRVPVADFRPSRSQRRCRERNADLEISVGEPEPTAEKHRLYARYLAARHDGRMQGSLEEFHGFLYASSSLLSVEIVYRAQGRLLAVGIADVEPLALSAVYCYFDPGASARGLGVFNVLTLIEACRRRGLPWCYLGYYVAGARTMSYKAAYRPCELLRPDGSWERLE